MSMRRSFRLLRFGFFVALTAFGALGLLALAPRGSTHLEDPPCGIEAFELGPNGAEMAGPAVPPGPYKLYKKVKGGSWITSQPFELKGGHRYLFNAGSSLQEDGGPASFSEDPPFTNPYSKPLDSEAIVHYQNTDMTAWISLTVCPVAGAPGSAPPCEVEVSDMVPGVESPGQIRGAGFYKLYVKAPGKPWISSAKEELAAGHRYLVDVTRLEDKGGAGFQMDAPELARYDKLNPEELVIHFKNPAGSAGPYSATVCLVGERGSPPPCKIDVEDRIPLMDETAGSMREGGQYKLYSKAKGGSWISSAPVTLAKGHKYLFRIHDLQQDKPPHYQEDPAQLNKYDTPVGCMFYVYYLNPIDSSKSYSATLCPFGGSAGPPCTVMFTDIAPGIETPGRLMPPGSYTLYTKSGCNPWISSAPADLRGGHRYLVDISALRNGEGAGFREDDVELGRYSKLNANEVVVHYKNPVGSRGPISATVCGAKEMDLTPTPEGKKIVVKTGASDCLDLIFVIDLTGSMRDDIDQVKRTALDILNTIKSAFSSYRVGFVGYKDWGDGADMFKDMPFTSDFDQVTTLINGLVTGGGGDTPEAVLEALLRALRMPWRNGCNKQIILMGDAPPHSPIQQGPDAGKTADDVVDLAEKVDPAVINSILIADKPGHMDESARKAFDDLAKRTGGFTTTADKAEEVPAKIKEVVGVIRSTATAPPTMGGGGGGPIPMPGMSPALIAAIALAGLALLLAIAIVVAKRRGAPGEATSAVGGGAKVAAGLSVTYADGGAKAFRITGMRTAIGRGEDNHLVLHDPKISTRHAELLASRDGFVLRDLGSANGTWVNGRPATDAYLQLGDDIVLGDTHLTFTE